MLRSVGVAIFAIALCAGLTGCRQDMQDQPRMFPLRGSAMFPDGRSARYQLAGTIARGQDDADSYFETGKIGGKEGSGLPFPVTLQVLERGQERFNIYCSPCHSRVGNGYGRIVERGYHQAADLQSERLREAPAGHFFNVITHGYGAMPEYRVELSPTDRWAIVAYIRALQLSQSAKTADAAAGARIASLPEIANHEGLPESLATADWTYHSMTHSQQPISPSVTPGSSSSTDSSIADGKTTPSATQQAAGKPAQPSPGDAAAGKEVYAANCQVCHQANRQGLQPMFPSLVGVVRKIGPAKVRETVLNGVPTAKVPMPSFAAKLSSADVNNLIAFLKTAP